MMQMRLDLRLLVAGLMVLGLAASACDNTPGAQVMRDVQELKEEIRDLKQSRAEHRSRLEELSIRLRVILDRQESEQMLRQRTSRALEELPVIRLGSEGPVSGSYSRIGGPVPDPTLATGKPGRPGKPKRPGKPGRQPPAARPRRAFSVDEADHLGIDPGPRLPIVPLPPARPSKSATKSATPPPPGPKSASRDRSVPSSPGSGEPAGARSRPEEPSSSKVRPARRSGGSLPEKTRPDTARSSRSRGLKRELPGPTGSAKGDYEIAFGTFKKGDYPEARRLFERLVERYPSCGLTDNAVYWMGEIDYKLQRFKEALKLFTRVVESYPTGNKVPDAFLKIGLCYLNIRKAEAAKKILEQVRSIFPGTRAALIAAAHLEKL